uniref:Uncharacterized protein n=1 Tax=Opuntia streptacantha TaxID=393608 RepID=A0A7C9DBY7_OPUST
MCLYSPVGRLLDFFKTEVSSSSSELSLADLITPRFSKTLLDTSFLPLFLNDNKVMLSESSPSVEASASLTLFLFDSVLILDVCRPSFLSFRETWAAVTPPVGSSSFAIKWLHLVWSLNCSNKLLIFCSSLLSKARTLFLECIGFLRKPRPSEQFELERLPSASVVPLLYSSSPTKGWARLMLSFDRSCSPNFLHLRDT